MEQIIITGSVSSAWGGFAVISFFGAFFGIIVAGLLHSNRFRRSEYQGITYSLRTSVIIGSFIFFLFVLGAYLSKWSHFYSVTIEDDKVHLQYLYPQREVMLLKRDIRAINREMENIKARSFAIVISDRNGNVYKSGGDKKTEIENALKLLDDSIHQNSHLIGKSL